MQSGAKHKICRLCLARQPPVCFSVFADNIATMVEALTSKKVCSSDVLTTVCLKCVLNLKLAYNFQQKIKQCEEKFKHSMSIKQEAHTLQHESVTISENRDVKIDKNLVKLCDNCCICGVRVEDSLINDHVRTHFDEEQKCDSCDASFTTMESYRQHLVKHPEKIINQCNNCGAKFYYKPFYDVHVKTECVASKKHILLNLRTKQAREILAGTKNKRPRSKQYAFSEANEETKKQVLKFGLRSSKAIEVLLGKETNKVNEDLKCKECGKEFAARRNFLTHTHKTKRCSICNRDISIYNFRRHVENHTSGLQVCHLCGATLQNKNSLITHIFYSHNHLRYKCEECGKAFKKKRVRDSHVSKYHLGKPTHYCDHCGKGFYRLRFLQKHIQMTHLKLRPHICSFCNKGFSSLYALKTHRRQHTNETPYRCEVCGEGFRQNVSLKGHKKSKHNIEEPKTCTCKVCGKGFASDVGLHTHMRMH